MGATTFVEAMNGLFLVTRTGAPVPTLTQSETLPTGLTFRDNADGTATFAGKPAAGTAGTHSLVITARNGIGNDATQILTLTVLSAGGGEPNPGTTPELSSIGLFATGLLALRWRSVAAGVGSVMTGRA
jgi:hypothetical protein